MPQEPKDKSPSILIVEDEQPIASRLIEAVKSGGWNVAGPAATLSDAQDLLSREPIAAAVLDYIVDGEHIDPIARELASRGIPFAITTGIMNRDEAGDRFGNVPIVMKPFQNRHVCQVVEEMLGRARRS